MEPVLASVRCDVDPRARGDGEFGSTVGRSLIDVDYVGRPAVEEQPDLTSRLVFEEDYGSVGWSTDGNVAKIKVDPTFFGTPHVAWALADDAASFISGVMIRYRRAHRGVGDVPFLAAGADEQLAAGDLGGSLDLLDSVQGNRVQLLQNQWQVAMWRRGVLQPLGGQVDTASLATNSEGAGEWLGAFLAPDSNPCATGSADCDDYPVTFIDFLRVWTTDRPTVSEPVAIDGLWYLESDGSWYPLPNDLQVGSSYELGVGLANPGSGSQSVHADLQIEIIEKGSGDSVWMEQLEVDSLILGSAESQIQSLGQWTAHATGVFDVIGTVTPDGGTPSAVISPVRVNRAIGFCTHLFR